MFNQVKILNAAKELAKKVHGEDPSGHDFHHIERVRHNALHLASKELGKNLDLFLIELASYLHDVDDPKLSTPGSQLLQTFLNENEVPLAYQVRVLDIIEHLSYTASKQGKKEITIEGQIVQDADRLDAIGAIGIARAFAYGGFKGRMMDDEDKSATFHHFADKLLNLKDLMNTEEAKRIAKSRHQYMVDYLKQFEMEKDCLD